MHEMELMNADLSTVSVDNLLRIRDFTSAKIAKMDNGSIPQEPADRDVYRKRLDLAHAAIFDRVIMS